MYFSGFAILLMLTVPSLAAPARKPIKRRAGVLSVQTYNQFQVSDGVAGNALAEVNAHFPVSSIPRSQTRQLNISL